MKRLQMEYLLAAAMCAIIILSFASSAAAGVIYVKWNSPGTGSPAVYNGESWDTAFHKVQDGLNAASSGDEVWVAGDSGHPYIELISLKSGVGLYGGFAGIESTRAQRDWKTNVTVLDGNRAGTVVGAGGSSASTVIDGFTIRNGANDYGGGINSSGTVTIANNTVTANFATFGGGMYCSSSTTICNNTITSNRATNGSGVYCSGSTTTICNNVISANSAGTSGGGIYCTGSPTSSPTICNNTITANNASDSGGIYSTTCSPAISNNIIAFNSSGQYIASGTPVLKNNCVYGNTSYNYYGYSAGVGNISTDPKLVAVGYGQVHIQPGSPCIDAGDDSVSQPGWLDIDGQPRIQGAHGDIGADESDGTTRTFTPIIVCVSPLGNDANDGSSWALAKKTVQAGVTAVSLSGGEVWVGAGTYQENIEVPAYVYLYGGFAGTEASRSQRDWKTNVTTLDGGKAGSVVYSWAGLSTSCIDGFTIRNGSATSGGGIFCYSSSPAISNNTIIANSNSGIRCDSASSPAITGNTITANSGVGIMCSYSSSPTISNNTIIANSNSGIRCDFASSPAITGNTITANSGVGIVCSYSSSPTISNNTIIANSIDGIHCYSSSSPTVCNNTVVGNSGCGITGVYSSSKISNNIVAFNLYGLSGSGAPLLRTNCVYGNTISNYQGISPGATDISTDPGLVAAEYGQVHIQQGSPCVNAGDDNVVQAGWLDIDGQPRIQGAHVDIGADESDGTSWAFTPAIVRVSPSGNDANDGSSWALAKKTVQAGASAASSSGGEVWVAAGTYQENVVLQAYAYLYGGFAGTETLRSQRDWKANVTVLDGGNISVVVQAQGGQISGCIDGFTIRNGGTASGSGINCSSTSPAIANNRIIANSGSGIYCGGSVSMISGNTITANSPGGIYCSGSSPTIVNNTITANSATNGGGIYCSSSSPTIANNAITGNSGGGIYCVSTSSPTITNNTITMNRAGSGGGVYCDQSSSPTISNNIVAFNSSGLLNLSGTPVLKNNCVYGNTAYNYAGLSAGVTDISTDPKLVAVGYGQVHIQPGSPCIDAGDDSAVKPGWLDIDGQSRMQGVHVDIGADETDGTTWTFTPTIVRVSPSGNDANDGSSWPLAKKTVQAGALAASSLGGEVWAAAGTYNESIVLPAYASLYGGFGGTETSRSQRDWKTKATILDGGKAGSVVQVFGGQSAVCIDGLTIRNGDATNGGGIYCSFSSPTIANNVITGDTARLGGGVYCSSSTAIITGNTIRANTATSDGGGIYDTSSSSVITNNVIRANSASRGGGMFTSCRGTSVMNNVIVENTASASGGAVYANNCAVTLKYNVMAFNTRGVYAYTTTGGYLPILGWNCVYSNTSYNYSGMTKPASDIALDPLFVNRTAGDYHLLAASPCIDAGQNDPLVVTDMDGAIRPQDGNGDGIAKNDIGAYEYPLDLQKAKTKLADGSSIAFGCAFVTGVFPSVNSLYVERMDRSSGIRVDAPGSFNEGQAVNVSGTIQTDTATGERYVSAATSWPQPTGASLLLRSMGLISSHLGGGPAGLQDGVWSNQFTQVPGDGYTLTWVQAAGMNNIGLLVTSFGNITYAGDGFFYVDDGCALNDGSGHKGVKVSASGLTFPTTGFVKVTGISSCEKNSEGKMVRVLKVRKQADIVPY